MSLILWLLPVLCYLVTGCHQAEMIPGCDQGALAAITAECREKVRAECKRMPDGLPDSDCPVLQECDRRIDAWEECK